VSRGVWFTDFHSICRLNLKFESSAIHTYYRLVFSTVRNAIDDLGFLDQVIGIVSRCLDVLRGVLGIQKSSICRLNLKFESSAIHTYFCIFGLAVRNAIDDLGFLDQVIGIELSNLGHCFHLMGHLRWPKEKRDRERGKETEKEEKRQRKRKRDKRKRKRDKKRERARGKRSQSQIRAKRPFNAYLVFSGSNLVNVMDIYWIKLS